MSKSVILPREVYAYFCPIEGCIAHRPGGIGIYHDIESAKHDARAHDRAGHRDDGSSKQTLTIKII